jgi:hypothetical protein
VSKKRSTPCIQLYEVVFAESEALEIILGHHLKSGSKQACSIEVGVQQLVTLFEWLSESLGKLAEREFLALWSEINEISVTLESTRTEHVQRHS